jgi:hypothetical protein
MNEKIAPAAFAALIALPLVACASAGDHPAPPASEPTTVDRAVPSTALLELRGGGDYMFQLDESGPASHFRTKCGLEHPVDRAAADACYAAIREEASHEGLRFAVDAGKHLVFTSFGIEDGREATYMEVPLAVASEGDRVVAMVPAGPAHGLQIDKKPLPRDIVMRVELVDDATIVMNDPQKGRLVFRRSH